MKVLMIGDVVAKPGRIAVLERIQDLREQHQIDLATVLSVLGDQNRLSIVGYLARNENVRVNCSKFLDLASKKYRELGPMLTPYASTLMDREGRAYAVTKDFKLAVYDPASDKATIQDIVVDGEVWTRANTSSIPTWSSI